ncbi:HAD-IC family P-type ATPase [Paraburkholderia tagetis]|uniref:HAD-IC family P-type ATPase n=1 Tax=Paraburkholderia tagetis TaxID=2913261 RepID=A0A9X1RR51_9BURK|nr:HAD-IC family P-type ATPase [Paraburkholderia tagetis]MCG5076711.1 HAD-IC family P-type ATPase [Paraburkholderia tagetis]
MAGEAPARPARAAAPAARVRRAGQTIKIHPGAIVKDDLIAVERGDQIVVDGVVCAANGPEIDESLLTGESEPQARAPGSGLLSGSFVVAGQGWYRATHVGREAWAQNLATQVRRFAPPLSELSAGIDRILRYISWAIAPLAALMVATQHLRGVRFGEALLFSAGGVACMVPEGLVLLMSVALAIGAMRLAQRGALMQELPAIETLARVDVVCLDKTGTLTEGAPIMERLERLGADPDVDDALAALVLNDPAPNATLRAIAANRAVPPPQWHAVHVVPFSSARKWASATFAGHGTWVLGAPDVIPVLCEGQRRRARTAIVLVTAVAVSLIAASRLYLGVHRVSDVVAGLSFGLAWAIVLAAGYSLQPVQPVGAKRLTGLVVLTLLVGAASHVERWQPTDVVLYRPAEVVEQMPVARWRAGGWRTLPDGRVAVVGRIDEPFSIQWATTATTVDHVMRALGWKAVRSIPDWLVAQESGNAGDTPVIALKFHQGAAPAMVFARNPGAAPGRLLVLRLWPASARLLSGSGHDTIPLWVGTVTREYPEAPLAWTFSTQSTDTDFTAPAAVLAIQFPDAQGVNRDDPGSSAFRSWDRRVWLLCTDATRDVANDPPQSVLTHTTCR